MQGSSNARFDASARQLYFERLGAVCMASKEVHQAGQLTSKPANELLEVFHTTNLNAV